MVEYDVVVVGGGPGGYAAALSGASAGLRVALVEMSRLGGTCLNVGCIPAKQLLETASAFVHVRDAAALGIRTEGVTVDWTAAVRRKEETVNALVAGLRGLLGARTVTVYEGRATLGPDRRVTLSGGRSGDVELAADAIVLAPGSRPRELPTLPVDGTRVLTSDEFLTAPVLHERTAIVGGGVVGCEFASMLGDVGSEVTLIETLPTILPGVDADVRRVLERSFTARGIDVRTGVTLAAAEVGPGVVTIDLGDGPSAFDAVVVAVGRRPNTAHLGLEHTAVAISDSGHIVVDDLCRTGEPSVWAVGDAIATPALAHVAFLEGMLAIGDHLGERPDPIDHDRVPWCIYTRPEIAHVGMSEAAAAAAGHDIVTAISQSSHNGRARIVGSTDGLVKVVAERLPDGHAGHLLGIHMVGAWVTEQIGQAHLAVNWDASVDDMVRLIQPHPTLTEVLGEALLTLSGRRLHG